MSAKRRKYPRRRKVHLGAPEEQHRKRATAFSLEAMREIERVRDAKDCRSAFDHLARAHHAHGGVVAEAAAMSELPNHLREAVRKIGTGIRDVHGLVAGRCLRGG
jgi:hypothetical protein